MQIWVSEHGQFLPLSGYYAPWNFQQVGGQHLKLAGTIKMWEKKKGFGFIGNGARKDIFVEGWDVLDSSNLRPGTKVEFEIEASPKGLRARKVSVIRSNNNNNHRQSSPPKFYGPMG